MEQARISSEPNEAVAQNAVMLPEISKEELAALSPEGRKLFKEIQSLPPVWQSRVLDVARSKFSEVGGGYQSIYEFALEAEVTMNEALEIVNDEMLETRGDIRNLTQLIA